MECSETVQVLVILNLPCSQLSLELILKWGFNINKMYFWNVLPATTNFSQSISISFKKLEIMGSLRKPTCLLHSLSSEKVNSRAAVFPELVGPSLASSSTTPDTGKHFLRFSCLYLFVPLDTPFLWHVQGVGNHVAPMFTSSCPLDFNHQRFPVEIIRASDVQYVGVYGIGGDSLMITLGNDLNRVWFSFVKWFFHKPHGCSC